MRAVLFSNFHVLDKLGSGSLRGVWQLEQLYPCGVRSYDDMNGSYISSMTCMYTERTLGDSC